MSKLALAIEQFDLEAYIEERVGPVLSHIDDGEQIRTYCPFCPSYDADRKGKFYANTESKLVFCQRCRYGYGVDLVRFIMDIEGVSRGKAIAQLLDSVDSSFGTMDDLVDRLVRGSSKRPSKVKKAASIDLPEGCTRLFAGSKEILARHAEGYLRRRGVTKVQTKRHQFYLCSEGKYRRRLVMPVFFAGELVHWVARDLSGRPRAVKYLTPPGVDQSLWLFNWDRVREKKRVVVTEGIFDALAVERARYPAVASFGKGISEIQARLLARFKEVVVFYDEDALSAAYRAARRLTVPARVARIEEGDPGGMKAEDIRKVVRAAPLHDSPKGLAQLFEGA